MNVDRKTRSRTEAVSAMVSESPSQKKRVTAGSSETAAEAVVRHLEWRRGEAKMEETAEPMLEDDGVLHVEQVGDTLVVVGDVDLYQAAEFRERAEVYINTVAQPRLDMSRVPFIDSAGLATLLALSRFTQAQQKSLRLIITGSPRRVLKITGIDRVLILED